MANTIALRKQYSTLLDEVYKLSSLTAVLDGPNELVKEGANANEILMCDCAYKYDQRDGITSENNDGYSVSFDVSRSVDSMLYRIAEVYLVNTGLMDLVVDDDYE